MHEDTAVGTAHVSIVTPDGISQSVLITPAAPAPAVLFLTDISGIRPAAIDRARRLAALGYAVLIPNVFYRSGEPPFFTFPIDFTNEALKQRFNAMTSALTPAALAIDAAAYAGFLAERADVQPGPIAIVGHCFTGAVALRMAATLGAAVRFAAAFHGGGLYTDTPSSPHLVLPSVTARLYFAHAIQDAGMPAEAIAAFERALADWGGAFVSETYDALHGWTMADHPRHHAAQAERAFERLAAQLADTFTAQTP